MSVVDLRETSVRDLNARLHALPADTGERDWEIRHPDGKHALVAGLTAPLSVTLDGNVGYFCGGMNEAADITVRGHCGKGVGENMASGRIRVLGDAADAAGASGHGGMIVIHGNASARCGISMKGVDLIIGGSVGHMSAFMGQSGRLIICGDADHGLGDSLYEAEIFVGGAVAGLGADCVEKEITPAHVASLATLLDKAGLDADAASFRRFGSARKLYNFSIDHADAY